MFLQGLPAAIATLCCSRIQVLLFMALRLVPPSDMPCQTRNRLGKFISVPIPAISGEGGG